MLLTTKTKTEIYSLNHLLEDFTYLSTYPYWVGTLGQEPCYAYHKEEATTIEGITKMKVTSLWVLLHYLDIQQCFVGVTKCSSYLSLNVKNISQNIVSPGPHNIVMDLNNIILQPIHLNCIGLVYFHVVETNRGVNQLEIGIFKLHVVFKSFCFGWMRCMLM